MVRDDIKVLIIGNQSSHLDWIVHSLEDYRQVTFGIVSTNNITEALDIATNRDIELAVVDASDKEGCGRQAFESLIREKFPTPIVVITHSVNNDFMELGAADCVKWRESVSSDLPKCLIKVWLQTKNLSSKSGKKIEPFETREARAIIEEQREIVERFQRVEISFEALIPEGSDTYNDLSESVQLQLKLELVEAYIDITKIYFARADEESEELIRKFCNQLIKLRFPPKELTSIHLGALELMLSDPGQRHRQGLISQNRLVFIDILLNLLGQYYALINAAPDTLSGTPKSD